MKALRKLLSTLLILAAGHTAAAQSTWTVSNDGNKFTISRSDINEREIIRFRTVGPPDEIPAPDNAHVLSQVNGVIGFYGYSGILPANKAYYVE